jgi:radical SAM superfamily enzyme YgiQ (UPF0313 family)
VTGRNRHVALVSFVGLRVREQELLSLGIILPGLENRRAAVAELPALGLLTLAGRLPCEWRCSYHEVDRWDQTLVDQIADECPCLVAISALTASVKEAYRFSNAVRKYGIGTVIGGLHATACPEEAARYSDAVVVGDGEPVWSRVLEDASLGRASGIYRADRPFNLSESKPPRFDLAATSPRSRFTIQTQRGCPFACEFCAASRLLGGFREKPARLLREELTTLKEIVRRPVLELADDNTFAGTRDQRELLGVLADAGVRYFTESDWRIGERFALLNDLAASGCVQVLVGVESLVHRYRGFGEKEAELCRVMAALDAIQDHGIAVVGCFVLGADGETKESIMNLTEFLLACPLADVQVTLQTPFPGSPLRKRLVKEGRILSDRGWDYYTLFDVTFIPDRMTVSDLEDAYRKLAGVVYSTAENKRRSSIRKRIWAKSRISRNLGCPQSQQLS